MAVFHVFVEGATDGTPAGLQRLAGAIGQHYGLPAADLHARLVKGRFRVKGNTDADTAALYKRDLERLGAIVTVEEANAENSGRATPLPFPAVRPQTPPVGTPAVRSATPPAGTPRPATAPTGAPRSASTSTPPTGLAAAGRAGSTSTPPTGLAAAGRAGSTSTPPTGLAAAGRAGSSSTPPTGLAVAGRAGSTSTPPSGLAAATPPPTGLAAATPPAGSPVSRPSTPPPIAGYQSGLAAAFSADAPAATLGALDGDNASFSLGRVDGNDEPGAAPPAASFEPPGGGGLPASIGPAPDKAAAAKPARPKDEPLDLFAPPDAQGDEFKVDIADDEKDISARKRASTPPPIDTGASASTSQPQPRAQTQPSGRKSQPSLQAPNVTATSHEGAVVAPSSSKLGPLGDERVRFAAGLVLSILLGFVPAHFVAGMREKSAYAEIDNKVIRAQQQADTPDTYAMLDRTRADLLARKEAERRNAAIIAIVIWGIAGAAIGFVWFRKIPWDSFE